MAIHLLEHPASEWSARVLGPRHKEGYPPSHEDTGWGIGPAKGSVREESEMSHSRACESSLQTLVIMCGVSSQPGSSQSGFSPVLPALAPGRLRGYRPRSSIPRPERAAPAGPGWKGGSAGRGGGRSRASGGKRRGGANRREELRARTRRSRSGRAARARRLLPGAGRAHAAGAHVARSGCGDRELRSPLGTTYFESLG